MPTNPRVHAAKATAANEQCDGQWKPVVKMLKKWNEHHDKRIKPSFLVEVMSLGLMTDWGGSHGSSKRGLPTQSKPWTTRGRIRLASVTP